jgi:hypothetical protein
VSSVSSESEPGTSSAFAEDVPGTSSAFAEVVPVAAVVVTAVVATAVVTAAAVAAAIASIVAVANTANGFYCLTVNGWGYPKFSVYPGYFPMSQLQACLPCPGLFRLRFVSPMVMLLEEQLLGQQQVCRLGAWYMLFLPVNGTRLLAPLVHVWVSARAFCQST